jgi:glycogen debranching enzyme
VLKRCLFQSLLWSCFLLASAVGFTQSTSTALASFPDSAESELHIRRPAIAQLPFSVVGPRGALLGQQDGVYEVWRYPWKILNQMRMSVEMQDYAVPIDVNQCAADIDVEPDRTTITYSHANFTIRQTMLAPAQPAREHDGAIPGAMVLYEFEAVRPMTITFSFNPVMQRMWPAESPDRPSPEWISEGNSGFYILHLTTPEQAAALEMPGATLGILPPYQERAATWPLQFVLHFDPKQDAGKRYPLLVTYANSAQAATKNVLHQALDRLNQETNAIVDGNRDFYRSFLASRTALETPDADLNAAFSWAEASIEQLRVETASDPTHVALTAGFVASADAARPGFGWFFGRDSLWSLYAVNSYGDYETTREQIHFLLDHQRADGKIMHERSQTADLVDWASLPYPWASSDATPLLAMAVDDYLKISGDRAFVASIWPGIERAWRFEASHDSDGDGIYDNSEGSGWVESWIPSMPHQEIYLATLDEQASLAFEDLARSAGHGDLAGEAHERAARIGKTIESEYYEPDSRGYAFSWNGKAGQDTTATIYPSVAWWDGDWTLAHAEPMMAQWAGSDFSTDWGLRDLSDKTSFYDPISYHQGSVWPLFTGWVSVAEYRNGHPLSGYVHLMQNANLTWVQDPGNVTELLSGQFFQVFGRSTAHQLWSSAMVISPVLRGMFGLEWNAETKTLMVTPHLPAAWDHATIRRLPFGAGKVDLTLRRQGAQLLVQASDAEIHLASHAAGARMSGGTLAIPLEAVEAGITEELPEYGAETGQMKVLSETYGEHSLTLQLSAPGGSRQTLEVRENVPQKKLASAGAELGADEQGLRWLTIRFPEAAGYTGKAVTLTW